MAETPDDRDLIECFNLIYELYPGERRAAGQPPDVPSPAESRDALRLFARIEPPELRTAVRILLRTLAAPITCGDPNGPGPSAANKPN